jgi:hypothetical protein
MFVCLEYLLGNCPFGARCPKEHVQLPPTADDQATSSSSHEDSALNRSTNSELTVDSKPTTASSESTTSDHKSEEICKKFKRGQCPYGQRCHRIHPGEVTSATAANQARETAAKDTKLEYRGGGLAPKANLEEESNDRPLTSPEALGSTMWEDIRVWQEESAGESAWQSSDTSMELESADHDRIRHIPPTHCRDWHRGYCPRGDSCWFRHDVAPQNITKIGQFSDWLPAVPRDSPSGGSQGYAVSDDSI